MKCQKLRLLDYLACTPEVDPLTAWRVLGIYRLGARVHDLRAAGHRIKSELREVENQFGEVCRVAFYRLEM